MKKIILLTVLFTVTFFAFGQPKKAEEVKEFIWGANDAQKNNIEVPLAWEDESAVILYKENFYDFHKFAKNIDYTSLTRQRIKLMDAAAVKEHSEFSFNKKFKYRGVTTGWFRFKTNKFFLGVKIIKPDGTEKEIKVDEEAVKADDKYKLAISGLEVGDILDFYVYTIESFKQKFGYTFDPITRVLNEEYNVKKMVMRFNTENDFFINFNSYNDAPELQEIETDKRNDRRYFFEATDIVKSDFPIWYHPLKELPYFKFKVTFARKGKYEKKVFDFMPEEEDIIKRQVTKEEILEAYKDHWSYKLKNSRTREINKFFEGQNLTQKQKIINAFYFYRHFYVTQFIERSVLAEAKIISPYYYGSSGYDDYFFGKESLALMGDFLDNHKIPYELVLVTPRYAGSLKDVLYHDEISKFIRVNLSDGPLYLPPLDYNAVPNQLNYAFENTDAYALVQKEGKTKLEGVKTIQTLNTTYKENKSETKTTVFLNDDFSGLAIERTSSYLGNTKILEQEDNLFYYDFIYKDYKKYANQDYTEKAVKKKKEKERISRESDALIKKLKERQKDRLKVQTENSYEAAVENYEFKILGAGRYGITDPMVVEEKFNIENSFIKKAGPNFILEIAKLIGAQINLNENSRNRENNIYMNFPRSFINEIELKIPKGYTVAGIDNLIISVKNETGGFISNATIDDDLLKIHTEKYYANYFENQNDWSKMVEFLDAANKFTQEKIMLKKTKENTSK